MFKGYKHTRYYVDIHQIALFENLMKEHGIKVISEIELNHNIKNGVFYVREVDIIKIDKVCLENDIHIHDDFSTSSEHYHWINKLPKNLKLIAYFFIFIIVLYFIFGDLL
jgi:hypothetical protein